MHSQSDVTDLESVLRAIRALQEDVHRLYDALHKGSASIPRLLTKAQAAAYCGVSTKTYAVWCRSGLMPLYLSGTKRFDRNAIDTAIVNLTVCREPERRHNLYLKSENIGFTEMMRRRGAGRKNRCAD